MVMYVQQSVAGAHVINYFSVFLAWHLYHLTPHMDVASVPVVAVTSFILAWFQRLGKGSGKNITSDLP